MLFSYHDSGSVCWSEICQQVVFGLPVLRNAVNYGHLCRRHPICHQASQFSVSSAELFYIDILTSHSKHYAAFKCTNYVSHSSQKHDMKLVLKNIILFTFYFEQ